MSYYIANNWKIIKSCDTLRGAKISYTRKYKELYPDSVIIEDKVFNAKEPMVETVNLMSGKKLMIKASEKDSCVDPGTERYFTM